MTSKTKPKFEEISREYVDRSNLARSLSTENLVRMMDLVDSCIMQVWDGKSIVHMKDRAVVPLLPYDQKPTFGCWCSMIAVHKNEPMGLKGWYRCEYPKGDH